MKSFHCVLRSGGCDGCGCSFPQGINYEDSCCWRFALPEEWELKPEITDFYNPLEDIYKCAAEFFDPKFTYCNWNKYEVARTYNEYGWDNLWAVCGNAFAFWRGLNTSLEKNGPHHTDSIESIQTWYTVIS